MSFSHYTERLVRSAMKSGQWKKWSDEEKRRFVDGAEEYTTANILAQQFGINASDIMRANTVIEVEAHEVKKPDPRPQETKKPIEVAPGAQKQQPKSDGKAKNDIPQRAEAKVARDISGASSVMSNELSFMIQGNVKPGSDTEELIKDIMAKGEKLTDRSKNFLKKTMLNEIKNELGQDASSDEVMANRMMVSGFVEEFASAFNEGLDKQKKAAVAPEPKPSDPIDPNDASVLKELGRASMHMTWEALRKAGIAPDKVKEFTKGYLDQFMEKSEAARDRVNSRRDLKVDGPRPEPAIPPQGPDEHQIVATDAMEAELAKAVQDKAQEIGNKAAVAAQEAIQQQVIEAIHQEPEQMAASTMTDITGKFVRPNDPAPTEVSAAMANPALRQFMQPQQIPQQQPMVQVRPAVTIPLPANWNQMDAEGKCNYYDQFMGRDGVPTLYNPWPDLDIVGFVRKLRTFIDFKPERPKLHWDQLLGLAQLVSSTHLASKMSELGAADPVNQPKLREIGIHPDSNLAMQFDMKFVMACADPKQQIIVHFNSIPTFKNGNWSFSSRIEKAPVKNRRGPKQQLVSATNRDMNQAQSSGLGMGVTIGDIMAQQQA